MSPSACEYKPLAKVPLPSACDPCAVADDANPSACEDKPLAVAPLPSAWEFKPEAILSVAPLVKLPVIFIEPDRKIL